MTYKEKNRLDSLSDAYYQTFPLWWRRIYSYDDWRRIAIKLNLLYD